MEYIWKTRDFFYNNGIVNLFWATQQVYSLSYGESDSRLILKPFEGLMLTLFSHKMVIDGEEQRVRDWYKTVSFYFINSALKEVRRIGIIENKLVDTFSYIKKPFADRNWKPQHIEKPQLIQKFDKLLIEKLLEDYEKKTGNPESKLAKNKLIKKEWRKKGFFIPLKKEKVIEHLVAKRDTFVKGKEKCEICGYSMTYFNKYKRFEKNSAVVQTAIGTAYSGFKDFMSSKNSVLCAFCDLALRYNFFWSFYVAGKPHILLHLDYPNLISLFHLKHDVFEIKMENVVNLKQGTNIPFPPINYYTSTERAILGLALYIAQRIATDKNFDIQLVTGEKSHLLKIISFYFDSTQISGLMEYHQFNLLVQWLSKQPSDAIIKPIKNSVFRLNTKNNQYQVETNLLRNMIYFQDISAPLAEIAYLKIQGVKTEMGTNGMYIPPFPVGAEFENLVVNFYKYIKEPVMNETQLQLLKDYGWALGTLARAVDDLTLFYELREAKKLDHVINVMRNFSFKLLREENTIDEKGDYAKGALGRFIGKDMDIVQLFESMQDQWSKARDLLLFFAVNNYLKKYDSKKGE